MDALTKAFESHYREKFQLHGMTARGVDWNDESEVLFRYEKMLAVMDEDFACAEAIPSLLDVGCGWGGLLRHAQKIAVPLHYSGIDVVSDMVQAARTAFPGADFMQGDVLDFEGERGYDFVVCSGILTLKLAATIPEMERYARKVISKMFGLCRRGIAFNMMSTRVNFMVDNLYYQNPSELLAWMLSEISPRVRIDHGYSSLGTGTGRLYEFTAYAFKD